MILTLDHVQLAIPPGGEDEARRFYGDLLGMAEEPKPGSLVGRGGCWFRAGGAALHLGVEIDFRPARKAHPAVTVEDLDGLARLLIEAGCPVRWDDKLPGIRRFYTEDPFGNRIECMEK